MTVTKGLALVNLLRQGVVHEAEPALGSWQSTERVCDGAGDGQPDYRQAGHRAPLPQQLCPWNPGSPSSERMKMEP
jgi:hypothetical protein